MISVFLRPHGTHVKSVIVRSPIAIALGIIIDPVVDHLIFSAGSRKGLSAIEYPSGIKGPALVQLKHTHDINIMPTVVVGVIPFSAVDAVDTGSRPGKGITNPSCQPSSVLTGTKFHAITLTFASQDQTLYLDLTTERLAVPVVKHVLYLSEIALHTEVIVLPRGHHIESATPLVGCLRLHDVAAHGITVEGGRCALVPEGMQILRGPCITRFDRTESRQLIVHRESGFQCQMRLHNLVLPIVVVPANFPIVLDVIIE